MTMTAGVWLALLVTLSILSLRRPVWAIALYMQTFFAAPHLWWWGRDVPSARYALWTGAVLLFSVILHSSKAPKRKWGMVDYAAIAVALNASLVHVAWSANQAISLDTYVEVLKYVLLYFMMCSAIRDKRDFRIALLTLALGAGYIGWEVTINHRGQFTHSRLEGVGAPAADTSNGLASLILLVLPLAGSLFVEGSKKEKLAAIVTAPLILNVLLLCNSRGAFLGLIGAGLIMLLLARGKTRKQAMQSLALGAFALYMLLGDPKILDRFQTTFVGSDERDNSAESRLTYWRAGLVMLYDYPLGAGGGAFKFIFAEKYLRVVGSDESARALHNGYLTEATDWGVQGLFFKVLFVGGALFVALAGVKRTRAAGLSADSLLGMCTIAAAGGFLITCIFGSFLNNEWSYWIVALMVRYGEIYRPQSAVTVVSPPVPVQATMPQPASAALWPSRV